MSTFSSQSIHPLCWIIRLVAVGVNTARFAPSIMTPTVRMGFSPSALLDYQAGGGGSKPPPYGFALVHPLCWIISLVAVGVNPHVQSNPHRTDSPWSIQIEIKLRAYFKIN